MEVNLINYTPDALDTLLYTKNTRLAGEEGMDAIKAWPMERKLQELAYMRDTIQSSWEFVDYTFELTGVTRALTHQLVRTRNASYAQESQRTVDVRDAEIIGPNHIKFDLATNLVRNTYAKMVDDGIPVQEARAILPTGTTTSIIAKFNLRTLHDMALVRLCVRTQGEYQQVFKQMVRRVVEVHPWAEDFLQVACVWSGVCVFPRYTQCPVQKHTLQATPEVIETIRQAWAETTHVANPVAKNGRTM